MWTAVALAAALAAGGCAALRGAPKEPLDGETFDVSLAMGGGSPLKDRLIFDGGRMESTVCTEAGFEKAAYSTSAVDGGLSFAVHCDSPTMGHNEWRGTVKGPIVEGTVVRTPKGGGKPIEGTFSGTLAR
jgi:hypothetical protein